MQTISKTIRLGRIPPKLIIIGRRPQKLNVNWYDFKDESLGNEMVTPAFAVPADSEAFLKTARSWAKSYFSSEDQGNKGHSETGVENTPQNGYRIVGLDIRCEGGRAYKVLDKHGRMFDLREDVLFDCMIEEGIDVGGCLKGKFLWGQVGSQMRLIRENSELHKLLLEATAKKEIKPIPKKDFEIGGIYRQRNGTYVIYLGQVNVLALGSHVDGDNNFTGLYDGGLLKVVNKVANQAMLLTIEEYQLNQDPKRYPENTPEKIWADILKTIKTVGQNYFHFHFQSSLTVIEKVGKVVVPADIIALIRNYGFQKTYMDFNNQDSFTKMPLRSFIVQRSVMSCLSPAGQWLDIPPEFKNQMK